VLLFLKLSVYFRFTTLFFVHKQLFFFTLSITQLFEVSITTRYQPMNDSNHSSGKMSGVI